MKKLLLAAAICLFACSASAQEKESKFEEMCRSVVIDLCTKIIKYECNLETPCFDQLKNECVTIWANRSLEDLDCVFLVNLENKGQ